MEKTIQRFHCTIVKMEISILYHVIVNSQLNRDNLTRCYIIYYTSQLDYPVERLYLYHVSILFLVNTMHAIGTLYPYFFSGEWYSTLKYPVRAQSIINIMLALMLKTEERRNVVLFFWFGIICHLRIIHRCWYNI